IRYLSSVPLGYYTRKISPAGAQIVSTLICLIVLHSYRRRSKHPGELAVGAVVLAIHRVWYEKREAAALSLHPDAQPFQVAPLSDRSSNAEALSPERLTASPWAEPDAQGRLGSTVGVGRKKSLAVERTKLIFERAFVDGALYCNAGAAARNQIVDERALDEILIRIRSNLFLTVRHTKLPETELNFINSVNVQVKIPQQRARGVRKITFNPELVVFVNAAFEREPCAAYKKRVRRVLTGLVAASVQLPVPADLCFKIPVGTSKKPPLPAPARQYWRFVLGPGLFYRRRIRGLRCDFDGGRAQ